MPMVSQSQRRYLWANDPALARRFEDHTPRGAKLPEKKKKGTEKTAVDVVPGGGVSRATSLTLGRVNPLNLLNLVLSPRAYHSSGKGDRPKAHAALAKAMESAAPEQLKDTVLRTEGTDFVDDMLWKKRHGDKDPGRWYNRIGGRIWQNPRTTSLMKALATVGYVPGAVGSNLFRSSHYSPSADAAVVYGDEPAVSTHELGHAVDFNDQSGPKPGLGGRIARDAYTALYGVVPPARLWHEAQANIKSRKALESGLKGDDQALHDILVRRDKTLPAGYGSYIGGAAVPFAGEAAPLVGLFGGKAFGLGLAAKRERDREKGLTPVATAKAAGAEENPMQPPVRPGIPLAAVLGGLVPAGVIGGAALGAARSPSVYGMQGAGRGALMGGGATLGAALGAGAGATLGNGGIGSTAVGGIAGAGLGALAARLAIGQHPRDVDRAAAEERAKQKLEQKMQTKTAAMDRLAAFLA